MSNGEVQFKARIQDFLNFHFPNDKHTFKDYCTDFYVIVGDEKNSKLIFNVLGTSIYRLTIHKDHYESIAPIFGLDNIDRAQFEILNDFLFEVSNQPSFKEFFEPINPISFSNILVPDFYAPSMTCDVVDSIPFTIKPKFNAPSFSCTVQFDWHFANTLDNTKLKGLPAICLTHKQPVRFAVGFDIQSKAAHIVTDKSYSYNDFFENNAVLQLDTQLDAYLNDFLSMLIEQQNKESFNGKGMKFNDLVQLLNMIKI